MGRLVQRAVLVELWSKIVHAALGFPVSALSSAPPPPTQPPPPPLSVLTPFSRMETGRTIFERAQ